MGKLQQTVNTLNDADQLRQLVDQCEKTLSVATPDEARLFLATLHQAHRQLEELQASFPDLDLRAESARLNTLDDRVLRQASRVIRQLGGPAAFESYRQQFDARPDDAWWQLDAEVASIRRRRLQRLGVFVAALAIIGIAAFLARDFLFPPNPVGDAVANAGAKLNAGDNRAALVEIELGLGIVPTSNELLIWKGILLDYAGDAAGAQAAFDQARAQSRDDREFYLTRAQTYIQLGLPDRVIADAGAVLAITPDSAEALYIRSTGYEMKGDRANAITDLDRSAELAQQAGNDALYAMARHRYAMLLQSVDQSTPVPSAAP